MYLIRLALSPTKTLNRFGGELERGRTGKSQTSTEEDSEDSDVAGLLGELFRSRAKIL